MAITFDDIELFCSSMHTYYSKIHELPVHNDLLIQFYDFHTVLNRVSSNRVPHIVKSFDYVIEYLYVTHDIEIAFQHHRQSIKQLKSYRRQYQSAFSKITDVIFRR